MAKRNLSIALVLLALIQGGAGCLQSADDCAVHVATPAAGMWAKYTGQGPLDILAAGIASPVGTAANGLVTRGSLEETPVRVEIGHHQQILGAEGQPQHVVPVRYLWLSSPDLLLVTEFTDPSTGGSARHTAHNLIPRGGDIYSHLTWLDSSALPGLWGMSALWGQEVTEGFTRQGHETARTIIADQPGRQEGYSLRVEADNRCTFIAMIEADRVLSNYPGDTTVHLEVDEQPFPKRVTGFVDGERKYRYDRESVGIASIPHTSAQAGPVNLDPTRVEDGVPAGLMDVRFQMTLREATGEIRANMDARGWFDDHPAAAINRIIRLSGGAHGEPEEWRITWADGVEAAEFLVRPREGPSELLPGSTVSRAHSSPKSVAMPRLTAMPTFAAIQEAHRQIAGQPLDWLQCNLYENICKVGAHNLTATPYAGEIGSAETGLTVDLGEGNLLTYQSRTPKAT